MEVPLLGSAAARQREASRTDDTAPQHIEAVTAFTVYITSEGRYAMAGLNDPVTAEREPTVQEVIAACRAITDNLQRQQDTEIITMNVLANFSRMQADPNYYMAVEQARRQAAAAAAAAAGNPRP